MDFMASQTLGMLAQIETERDDLRRELHIALGDIARLERRLTEVTAERDKLRRLDSEASSHVESLICMRTDFTGMGDEIGWKGLGMALKRAFDERDRLRAIEALREIGDDRPTEQAEALAEKMAVRIANRVLNHRGDDFNLMEDVAEVIEPYLASLLRYSWGAWVLAKKDDPK